MNAPEWLRPDVIGGTVLYAVIGVVVLWLAFIVIDKLTPYHLWDELVREKNVALGIVVGGALGSCARYAVSVWVGAPPWEVKTYDGSYRVVVCP